MSNDIDFYPRSDPRAATMVSDLLGEGSEFHDRNGYYLDPITPALPVLPNDWESRLVKIELGQITACFLDVNDTAVSKYARSADNDFRWLEAGYETGILDINAIVARVRFSTRYTEAEDKRKTLNGLSMHREAMQENGTFDQDLLGYLRSNPPANSFIEVDFDSGDYLGPILWKSETHAVQSLGRGNMVIHRVPSVQLDCGVGTSASIKYCDGKIHCTPEQNRVDRGVER